MWFTIVGEIRQSAVRRRSRCLIHRPEFWSETGCSRRWLGVLLARSPFLVSASGAVHPPCEGRQRTSDGTAKEHFPWRPPAREPERDHNERDCRDRVGNSLSQHPNDESANRFLLRRNVGEPLGSGSELAEQAGHVAVERGQVDPRASWRARCIAVLNGYFRCVECFNRSDLSRFRSIAWFSWFLALIRR